jgi:hypothetical protein
MVWRVLAAAVLVIGASAGALATAGLLQFNSLAQALRVHAGVSVRQLSMTLHRG